MQRSLLIIILLIVCHLSLAQAPALQWQKTLGGTATDQARSIETTSDDGYIVAGHTYSNDGNVSGNHGGSDFWILKLNDTGGIKWQKCLGGDTTDYAAAVQQTIDGGYIVAGTTLSNNGQVSGNHGLEDFWVVKLNDTGGVQWQKCLGGSNRDYANAIQQTSDGGYIVAGFSYSNDGDVTGHHGTTANNDYWIVKLNDTGRILWQKSLGGSNQEEAWSVQQTKDGGYVIAGRSFSLDGDGDVTGHHGDTTKDDFWVVKLDPAGAIQWQKSLGGSGSDFAYAIRQTTDSGYIVAGETLSNDGDVSGNHGVTDYWVVKLNTTGAIQWQKCLGGSSNDDGMDIRQTTDGGYIVAGWSSSNDSNVSGNHGFTDYWVVKLNSSGSIKWQKSLGGTDNDVALAVCQARDGGYVVAGYTYSNNGDVSGYHAAIDYWIVKLKSTVSVDEIYEPVPVGIIPNPTTGNISITGAGLSRIMVYDALGYLVKDIAHADSISIAAFPPGIFLVKVFDAQGKLLQQGKVVKK